MGMGRKPTKDKGPRLFILINPVIFIVYCMCYLKFFGEKVKVGVGGKQNEGKHKDIFFFNLKVTLCHFFKNHKIIASKYLILMEQCLVTDL